MEISYLDTGKGKPVVLVHGFGEDGRVWDNQVNHLKDKYRLFIPDLPGSGNSQEPTGPWLMEDYAEMIKLLLEKEEISQCTVIGHSMGGYITMAFAEKYPGKLTAFGLFQSTAYADSEEKKLTRQKGISFIREHGAFEFLKTAVPNLFAEKTREKNPGLISQFIKGLSNFSPGALVNYYEAMMQRPDRTSVLKNTGIPVLFVMGKYDTAVPMEDVLKQCHLPEKAYIEVLHNSGHMGMLEEPGASNRILEKFLAET